MINHVTYHIQQEGLRTIDSLMRVLGFEEVPADDPFEHGYNVRWFKDPMPAAPLVHFVADGTIGDILDLGHICVVVPRSRYEMLAASEWCGRNSGSGRIWLKHDALRVEVRAS